MNLGNQSTVGAPKNPFGDFSYIQNDISIVLSMNP